MNENTSALTEFYLISKNKKVEIKCFGAVCIFKSNNRRKVRHLHATVQSVRVLTVDNSGTCNYFK
jgi:hypothetical protein